MATLTGSSAWGGKNLPEGCRSGIFPAQNNTIYSFPPGATGSVTLTQDPFSSCPDSIPIQFANGISSPFLTAGSWLWAPHDPFVGYANLTCAVVDQAGSRLLTWEVNGLTCTISDMGKNTAGSFASSAAPLRAGKAVTLVHHSPGSAGGKGSSRGDYEVTLRDLDGDVHGRKEVTINSGPNRKVPIPISGTLRKQVAKKGVVKVKATVKRADGKRGTGHRTSLKLIKDHPGLPF